MRTLVSTRWIIPNQRFRNPTDLGQKERLAGREGEIELADLVHGFGKGKKNVDGVVAAGMTLTAAVAVSKYLGMRKMSA
jgi:hypothetical protein